MFQNSSSYKKQDKICSISNFSSSQNTQYLNEHQIAAQARTFASQLKRHQQKRFHKPVFIITPELTSKHINALTQILQKNRVPIQYQHQTQSLGQQLNTRFFVVVDNKNGTQILGKEFNSPLMTVIGYPKIGNNKQNIYCQYAQDVFHQYKQFVNANSKPMLAEEDYQVAQAVVQQKVRHQQQKNESLMKNSASSGFSSVLRSNLSGLKLKSISKYDREKRQVGQKNFSYNKENITSIKNINLKGDINNLYFLESLQNQPFNNMIGRYYHEIKLNTSKNIEETTFYFRGEEDLVRKLNDFNPFNSSKSMKKITSDKLHYVLVSSESALRLATRIKCEFFSFKDKIRLIVAMLHQQSPSQDNEQAVHQKQMLLVKKTIQSDIFQSLVCSEQQCHKMLKSIGFKFNQETPQIKVGPNDCKSILNKSHKKINNGLTQKKIKIQVEAMPVSDDIISFCPKLRNTVHINEEVNLNHTLRSETMTVVTQKTQRDNNIISRVQEIVNQPQHSTISQQIVPQSKIAQMAQLFAQHQPNMAQSQSFGEPRMAQTQQFAKKPYLAESPPFVPQHKRAQTQQLAQKSILEQSQQFVKHQSNISSSSLNRPKIIIPSVNSFLSPQKSNISSTGSKNGSKIKIIKVIKKQPLSNSVSKAQDRGKSISQVNSEYCLNKNKSIVEKMQSKMVSSSSRTKLKSNKQIDSLKSIENHLKSQEKIIANNNGHNLINIYPPQSKGTMNSSQKSLSNPAKFQNLKDSNVMTAERFGYHNPYAVSAHKGQQLDYNNPSKTYPERKKVLGYNNLSATSPSIKQTYTYNNQYASPDTKPELGHKNPSASISSLYHNQPVSSPSPNNKQFKKMKMNLNTEEPFVATCSQVTLPDDQQSQSSYKNIRKLKKSVKKDKHDPLSASEYYFGSSMESNKQKGSKKAKPRIGKQQNFINGLVHVEYNEFIGMIVNEFKRNCPSSIINKESYRPFYLCCEYSKQIKRLWKNTNHRGILPSLVDIQGLRQICKYYSNVTYQDDEIQFCATASSQPTKKSQKFYGNKTVIPNQSEQTPHMLLFFTIVTQKQVQDQVFQRLDWIAQRLPRHEIIKCVIEQKMTDKQMREKANQIYTQMVGYFTELKEEYGERFVQTV